MRLVGTASRFFNIAPPAGRSGPAADQAVDINRRARVAADDPERLQFSAGQADAAVPAKITLEIRAFELTTHTVLAL